MLENLLTSGIVAIVLAFSAIVVFDFVTGLVDLAMSKPAPTPNEQLFAQLEPLTSALAVSDPWLFALEEASVVPNSHQTSSSQWKPVLCLPPARDVVVPNQQPQSKRKSQPELSKLSSVQLRSVCSQRGIAWRNAAGGKHLTKAQMIERLTA